MKSHSPIRSCTLVLCLWANLSAWAQYKADSTRNLRTQNLRTLTVDGSEVGRVTRSAYHAVAVDTRRLRNTNDNLAAVLDRVAGVKIREEGGLGSGYSLNLNGFTGRHVRIFIDGMPMEGSASSFGLNNIPVSLASRVEVYKGVVPVSLGGDALGGAIHVVTDRRQGSYVDASYSYGSFNTHRTSLALGHTTRRDVFVNLHLYQNYSDNDYRVRVPNTDLQTMQIASVDTWHRRFHDQYHNEAGILSLGIQNKSWADLLSLGLTYSQDCRQIQHANLMKIVFGKKFRRTCGWSPTFQYTKRDFLLPGLSARLSARYDVALTENTDTAARTYNWSGQYVPNAYQGEGVATLAAFTGRTLVLVGALDYHVGTVHRLSLNNSYTNYRRRTTDRVANAQQATAATYMRRLNVRDILGLSYQYVPSASWNALVFIEVLSHASGRSREVERPRLCGGYAQARGFGRRIGRHMGVPARLAVEALLRAHLPSALRP